MADDIPPTVFVKDCIPVAIPKPFTTSVFLHQITFQKCFMNFPQLCPFTVICFSPSNLGSSLVIIQISEYISFALISIIASLPELYTKMSSYYLMSYSNYAPIFNHFYNTFVFFLFFFFASLTKSLLLQFVPCNNKSIFVGPKISLCEKNRTFKQRNIKPKSMVLSLGYLYVFHCPSFWRNNLIWHPFELQFLTSNLTE